MIIVREYGSKQRVFVNPKDKIELSPSLSVDTKDTIYTSTRRITIKYKANKDVLIYVGKVKKTVGVKNRMRVSKNLEMDDARVSESK